jgi:hypothetical protein
MKAAQPFFLGAVGGLALTLAIAIGLFLSPIRRALYLEWDPELSRLRSKTDQIRERMAAGEMGMADGASAAAEAPADAGAPEAARLDSLRSAQAGAWKEYKHWRNRLGELSRAHDEPRAAAFPAWAYSLRYGLGPLAAVLSLAPALFFGIRSARRPSRAPRAPKAPAKAPPRPPSAPEEALSSFQSAVKQVARIAAPPLPPAARPVADPRADRHRTAASDTRAAGPHPEVPPAASEDLFKEPSPYEVESGNVFRTSDAEPDAGGGSAARPEALETQIFQLGPGGWGEPRPASGTAPASGDAPASRPGQGGGNAAGDGAPGGLSMEDEDGPEASGEDAPAGSGGHFMPPTTEVERVERRKAEVVKLARKGMTSSEISRRLRISQDQVEFIIRMRREKG